MENKVKINVATHSLKVLDSRNKQTAIRTELNDLGNRIFASHLLKTKVFASPFNAALIRDARAEAVQVNEGNIQFEKHIPRIEDGKLKQLLIPFQNDYLSITPSPNLHVIESLNKYRMAIHSYHKQCLQPVGAAITNHGDPLISFRGYLNLVRNWIPKYHPEKTKFNKPVILIQARCENMNVSSSYVSTGLPQLTAIGGFIHTIERALNIKLPFGFGIQFFKDVGTVKKGVAVGRDSNSKSNAHKNVLFCDEITANTEIAFVLGACDSILLQQVKDFSKTMNRFSGGCLFDIRVSMTDEVDGYFWYEADSDPTPLDQVKISDEVDYKHNLKPEFLDDYINWENENPAFSGFLKCTSLNYKLIQAGYALLNEPTVDPMARSESKLHAWAEPVFTLIQLTNSPSFFTLNQKDNLFIWE